MRGDVVTVAAGGAAVAAAAAAAAAVEADYVYDYYMCDESEAPMECADGETTDADASWEQRLAHLPVLHVRAPVPQTLRCHPVHMKLSA